jgi:hypothetical protein
MAIEFGRLEDIITLASEGKDINAEVELKKQVLTQKIHPEDTEGMKREIDMYLLIGVYTFQIGNEIKQVSKVYVYGFLEEPPGAFWVNVNIANARLKIDYQRLKDAKIVFKEKYF